MPSVAFEPTISAIDVLQNYALDRAATGVGIYQSSTSRTFPIYIQSLTI